MSNKKGRFASRILWAFCLIMAIGGVLAASYIFWKLFPGNGSDDGQALAAWIQAIGSISAIVGALWINERQTKAALASVERAQLLVDSAKRKSFLAIAKTANEYAERIGKAISSDEVKSRMHSSHNSTMANGITQALTRIPVHEIGSHEGVTALLYLLHNFSLLNQATEEFKVIDFHPRIQCLIRRGANLNATAIDHPLIEQIKDYAKEVSKQFDHLAKSINDLG